MKIVPKAKWLPGSELSTSSLKNKTSAILAIKDIEQGEYFVVPDIFLFDESLNGFVAERAKSQVLCDFWYMLEEDLLASLQKC